MTKTLLRYTAGAILLIALAASRPSFAQLTSGDLTGTITDASGGVVPKAAVEAVNTATGVKSTQTSNAEGTYRFSNLPVGTYDVSVTVAGFSPATAKAVNITLNRAVTQSFSLQVGTAATTVEVTEAAQQIDISSAQITNTFQEKMVADLPVTSIGQGVINLSLLSAGVASGGAVGVGEGPSVGGQRPRNNNFMIEGIDNNSKVVTGPLVYTPNDSVQEFTMLQNQFGAEFGHSSGGQFNTVVKSGTNTFHGTLYDYLENRKLNANDNLNAGSPKPRFDQNRLGGNFGGPLRKNKLFFFGSYEYNPVGQSSQSAILTPTATGMTMLAALPGISKTNLGVMQQYTPVAPVNNEGVDPVVIPATGATVNIPIGDYTINAPAFVNNYFGVYSLDYTLSPKDQLRGRVITNKQTGFEPSAEPELLAFFLATPTTYYLATGTWFHNFTPNLTNELRLGYNRYNQNLPAGDFKFPGLDQFPNIQFDELGTQIGVYTSSPQFTIQNTYQVTNNVIWTHGRHSWKFGFDGRKAISPQSFTQRGRGDYDYDSIGNFLYDLTPWDAAQRSTGSYTYYGDQISTYLYASDTWKASRHLTLDLGVRWEFTSVPYAERLQAVNKAASVPGLITFGEPQPQYKNFAPRIGLAYSPGNSGNTSLRAGFGMAYDVLFDNLGILSSPPQFSQTVDVTCSADNGYQCAPGFLAKGGIGPGTSAGTLSVADARAATSGYVPDQVLPYSLSWNFGVQHVFHKDYTFEARYVGTRGVHLPVQIRMDTAAVVQPGHSLPMYITKPSQAVLDSLPLTLKQLTDQQAATGGITPAYFNAGFQSLITSYQPWGNSTYHGLDLQLDRRFSNGLVFRSAYTWSHAIDDSTAEVFSTVFTPRRPEDAGNLRLDRSDSALDHRQRYTMALVYDTKFFSHDKNWLRKNILGNWEVAPIYTYQSPEKYTVQSGIDANLNAGDALDRSVINPDGVVGTSTTSTALTNSAGQTVAYVAKDPTAQYIQAGKGVMPNSSRNTLPGRPINNLDLTLLKRFTFKERYHLELQTQMLNSLNHPQYIPGRIDDVFLDNFSNPNYRTMLLTGNPNFNNPAAVLSSNPRTIQLTAKFKF